MKFAKERANIICQQLKSAIPVQRFPVNSWKMKEGCFLNVDSATASEVDPTASAIDKVDLTDTSLDVERMLTGALTSVDTDNKEWKDFDANTDRWYGKDKHFWFRTEIEVPKELDGKNMWLYIWTQIEEWDDGRNPQFIIFINGVPRQGFDINHREILVFDKAKAGTKLQIDLQAYTGTLHDEFRLQVDMQERSEEIKDLYYDIQVPLWGLQRMDDNVRERWQLEEVINNTINLIDFRNPGSADFLASVKEAHEYIQKNLYENPELTGFDDVIATCIGHTHIDVAWLWTVAQVRQKSCRSFCTVLKLMEEFPNYKFMSSQPQLYEFVKQRYPELFEEIKKRVAQGRWEPEGGMWVEADCNLTSGESLVRQFLFGKRFFKEEFGKDNTILWLPDVFGYSGALPQIMKKSGIKYFMTTKLAWNQFNKVPMDTFWWEGIDGSRVFTHLITTLGVGQNIGNFFTTYNGMLHPDSIMGGWLRYQNKEINNDILVSYGFGDGGGGPTREMLETSIRMEKGIKGIPKVRQETSRKYFDELLERVKDSKRLPSWVGELYFEYHRGTLTSMGRNKRGNRKSEYQMMELEFLSTLNCFLPALKNAKPYPEKELKDMWKLILRNQFHDILPGSSNHDVYEYTRKDYEAIMATSQRLISERLEAFIDSPSEHTVTVFNTLGYNRNDIVTVDIDAKALTDGSEIYPVQKTANGNIVFIKNIPSKGYKTLTVTDTTASDSFTVTANGIETPFFHIAIDEFGQFTSIFDKEASRELLLDGQIGNELRVYEDKPMCFDNWDIDIFYQEKSWPVIDNAKCEWIENGSVRATLKVTKNVNDTTVEQFIHFYANTRRIDFETKVDWKMSQHLLKVHFPVDIHTDEATFDIQFGNIKRKIHQNTSWDVARFESCAHKFVDMSEGEYGVSLMNDCKYGHSVLNKKLSVTLIKSGTEPNETTDQEIHTFTYSLYPHLGDWRTAHTYEEAFNLNVPARVIKGGKANEAKSFMSVDRRNVILETIKKSEDGNDMIVRMYEVENTRCNVILTSFLPISKISEVNLMEEPVEESKVTLSGNKASFQILPYEVKTYRISF